MSGLLRKYLLAIWCSDPDMAAPDPLYAISVNDLRSNSDQSYTQVQEPSPAPPGSAP